VGGPGGSKFILLVPVEGNRTKLWERVLHDTDAVALLDELLNTGTGIRRHEDLLHVVDAVALGGKVRQDQVVGQKAFRAWISGDFIGSIIVPIHLVPEVSGE